MNSVKNKTQTSLLDQKWALKAYLEDLLKEAGFDEQDNSAAPVQDNDFLSSHSKQTNTSGQTYSEERNKGGEKCGLIPRWAQSETHYLNFRVADMCLTAPLDRLSGVFQATDPITALPGQAHWMKGLLSNRGQTIKIVDTQQLVRSGAAFSKPFTGRERPDSQYILLMDDGHWGLTCDAVTDIAYREPDEIIWQLRGRMPSYLVGTVTVDLRTVVDIEVLVGELNSGILV